MHNVLFPLKVYPEQGKSSVDQPKSQRTRSIPLIGFTYLHTQGIYVREIAEN